MSFLLYLMLFQASFFIENYSVYRLYTPNIDYNHSILKIEKNKYYDIAIRQSDLSRINKNVFCRKIAHDAGKYISSFWDFRSDMGAYHTYEEMLELLDSLVQKYPDIAKIENAGNTYLKRNIPILIIGNDNYVKPCFLFVGLHHGNEVVSTEVTLTIARNLLSNRQNSLISKLLKESLIIILPMLNVDGHIESEQGRFRRKNMRPPDGVDLNRNYSFKFGYDDRGSSSNPYEATYRGEYSFSESETRSIKDLFEKYPVYSSISYHSEGSLILYPFGFAYAHPIENYAFTALADTLARDTKYMPWQTIFLYPTNGEYCDWSCGEKSSIGFTIELSEGYPESTVLDSICKVQTEAAINFMRTQITRPYLYPLSPIWEETPDTVSINWRLKWHFDNNLRFVKKSYLWESSIMDIETENFETFPDTVSPRKWFYKGFSLRHGTSSNYIRTERQLESNSWLQSSIPVKGVKNCSFNASWLTLRSNDCIYFQLSTDYGRSWFKLDSLSNYSDWTEKNYSLSDFPEGSEYIFRFSWIGNPSETGEYLSIDDFYPVVNNKTWSFKGESADSNFKFNNHDEGKFYFISQGENEIGKGLISPVKELFFSETGYRRKLSSHLLPYKPGILVVNPCRGAIRINLKTRECEKTKIILYDIRGRRMKILFEGLIKDRDFRYEYPFEGKGMYFIKFIIGNYQKTMKLVSI
ncbi:MAG: hypothetical protein JXA60_10385 [Candidatus Coatesbacteria bacterium]|nr:hypothetical protein [Candidatus Coatesbacteria bacterium]